MGSADGHTSWVMAVTTSVLDGRPVAVTGSGDHTVRLWDLKTGEQVGAPWIGHTSEVRAIAVSDLAGVPIVISGGSDGVVRLWELASGRPVGEPIDLRADTIWGFAIAERRGRRVVVTGCHDRTARVWDLDTGQEVMTPIRGHTGPVYAVATVMLDGRWVAVTAGDRTVRVWDLDTGEPVGSPFTGHTDHPDHPGQVSTLAVAELADGRPVAVSSGYRLATFVSDLATGLPVTDLPIAADWNTDLVSTAVVHGRPVALVCRGDTPTIQVWDLSSAELVGELFPQHPRNVIGVTTAMVDGRQVVVSTCDRGTIRVSELVIGEPIDKPVRHDAEIKAVATTTVGGRPVVITGGDDETVRVWELSTGDQVCAPLTGHTGAVTTVAATTVDGRAVAVTGGADGTVHRRDLDLGKPAGAPLAAHHRPITSIGADGTDGRPRAITAGDDKKIRLWDLRTGEETGKPRASDHRWVHDLATTTLDGRPVAVLGRWGGGFKVRDLTTNRDTSVQTTGGNGKPVRLVAATVAAGRSLAVTTYDDWRDVQVKVWDVATAQQIGHLGRQHLDALAAATVDGHPVAVVAIHRTVSAYSLVTFDKISPDLELPEQVAAVDVTADGHIVVCFDRDVAVFTTDPVR
ncbi:WD40 repeat domain-containing protein [Hamadaea sp. NPDC051192]|uniref:WD40 repeat domain-containing protein n=1 Tax=Hamadaea sp. NPDC051192 TaxID=3154940 RepID=UPI003432EFB4